MNLKIAAGLAACFVCASPAFSAPITLDFEGATSFDSIGDFYSSYGVSFGLDALALSNDAGSTFYSNAPTNGTVLDVVGSVVNGAVVNDAVMNVAGGFSGEASFSYSSAVATTVGIYSGLNGTGTLLGTFTLAANATDGCSDSDFCNWSLASTTFAGVAQSIQFSSLYDADLGTVAGIDNVTINTVPLPAGLLLLPSGLAMLGFARRRKVA